mmetsp:Transcript_15527/g.35532  ORF Transcript_15527/g.35532 Transcript_15527/m.35532 type:complete len:330 (+) Transcript_15527:81-1070(+)
MGNTAQGQSEWNSASMMSQVGMDRLIGFEKSAKMIINMNSIPPWRGKDLIMDNLRGQAELATRTPLKKVSVHDGLEHFTRCMDGEQESIERQQFIDECVGLLGSHGIQPSQQEHDDLFRIFDAMDLDRNRRLSRGEVAGGLSVFFEGTEAESIAAVFKVVDQDHNGFLSKAELQEYLRPFINAMTPKEAKQLRPLLLKRLSDDIYQEMNLDMYRDISSDEMLSWVNRGNSVIDRTANLINDQIYPLCTAARSNSGRQQQQRGLPGMQPAAFGAGEPRGPPLQYNGYSDGMAPNGSYGFDPPPRQGSRGRSRRSPRGGSRQAGFNSVFNW